MPTFNSLNELSKHLATQTGQQMLMGTQQVKLALKEAADLLYKLLHTELENYYASYTPVVYHRTFGLLNSLRISPIQQTGNQLSISVYFDEASATHPSIFGGEDGFTPILLNEGWKWNNDIGIHHLSNYEGFHFVEKAISAFNSQNRWGFKITKQGHHNG